MLIRFLIAFVIVLIGCNNDKTQTGYAYYPDMVIPRPYKTYMFNPVTGDSGKINYTVYGTYPRHGNPHYFNKMRTDRDSAGLVIKNPLEINNENLIQGRKLFQTYCINCHGTKGDGKGNLVISKKFTYPPAKLNKTTVKELPDGNIYNVISKGFGVMGAHGCILLPEERWLIVGYLKHGSFN